jgi:hypothetical protein
VRSLQPWIIELGKLGVVGRCKARHQTFDILIVALHNAKQREKTPENA